MWGGEGGEKSEILEILLILHRVSLRVEHLSAVSSVSFVVRRGLGRRGETGCVAAPDRAALALHVLPTFAWLRERAGVIVQRARSVGNGWWDVRLLAEGRRSRCLVCSRPRPPVTPGMS